MVQFDESPDVLAGADEMLTRLGEDAGEDACGTKEG